MHEGTITPELPNVMWGTDATGVWTEREGLVTVFAAIDHAAAECVGIHAVKRATRFEAVEPIRQGARKCLGASGPASPVASNCVTTTAANSSAITSKARSLSSASSRAQLSSGRPRATAASSASSARSRSNSFGVRSFGDADEVRHAVAVWVELYNEDWLIERHGHRPPAAVRRELLACKVSAKLLSTHCLGNGRGT